jgi:Flp pilus assembly protein TadD
LPRNHSAWTILANDYQPRVLRDGVAYNQYLLRANPDDPRAHKELGKSLLFLGKQDEALRRLRIAADLQPADDEVRYYLGLLFRMGNDLPNAQAEFESAIRLNPDNGKAHGNLGMVYVEEGQLNEAESHFKSALRVNPDDSIAREGLDLVAKARAPLRRN